MKYGKSVTITEICLLAGTAIIFLVPIKIGVVHEDLINIFVAMYYSVSLIIIFSYYMLIILPLKSFKIISSKLFLLGCAVKILIIGFWIGRVQGRTLDFSSLEDGNILAPLAMAVIFPSIQAFILILSTNSFGSRNV